MTYIPIRPAPQRWGDLWLWCNLLCTADELAEVLRKVRGCNIYHSDGVWWEDNHAEHIPRKKNNY
jgi:hypothetical protein